jgi:hypothetical protein
VDGKSAEAVLAEFQRAWLFLTHVLECPVDEGAAGNIQQLLAARLPSVLTRIRRSLKPKKLAPISEALQQFLPVLNSGELPCAILLDKGKPFTLQADTLNESAIHLREALKIQISARQSFT